MTGTTHATERRWRRGAAGLLAAGALPILAAPALAQQGGFYVGLPAAAERLDVRYDKAVDNTDPRNMSPGRGEVYRADSSATGATGSVGFAAGYSVPFGMSGVFLSGEVDVAYARGTVGGAWRAPVSPRRGRSSERTGRRTGPSSRGEATASRRGWAAEFRRGPA